MSEEPLLPALAKAISGWFPELDGRALAVSECKITTQNMPTLPLVMLALIKDDPKASARSGQIEFNDDFVIEFWTKPERYKLVSGAESPFWGYFNYEALRTRLLTHLDTWVSPSGNRVQYKGLDVESDEFAIVVSFRFNHQATFCADDFYSDGDGQRILSITSSLSLISSICQKVVP